MKKAGFFLGLWMSVGTWTNLSAAVEAGCDIPTNNLESITTKDADACAALCEGKPGCAAFVFASGWNRCFLKSAFKSKAKINFYSSQRADEGFDPIRADTDHKGKDLRNVPNLKTPEDCQAACAKEPACQAFTYIKGYAACWLKKNTANYQPKIFYCGVRAQK